MFIKLSSKFYKPLSLWLRQQGHKTHRVVGHLRSHVLGLMSCDVIVDTWPEPGVVVIKPGQEQLSPPIDNDHHCTFYSTVQQSIFRDFILQPGLLDWTTPMHFTNTPKNLLEPISSAAEIRGGKLLQYRHATLMHVPDTLIPNRLQALPGTKVQTLKTSDCETIIKSWVLQGTKEYMRFLVDKFPSIAIINTDTNELMAWVITYHCWTLGFAHVVPKFRRMSLGSYFAMAGAMEMKRRGIPTYMYVADKNNASFDMLNKLGVERTDVNMVWTRYAPGFA